MSAITITPIATFRTDEPYPFCPGCGHGPILDRLNEALIKLDLDPAKVVIVSDIGCSGLSDQYFVTSAFHGLHGRSTTYATGIKLANPDLEGADEGVQGQCECGGGGEEYQRQGLRHRGESRKRARRRSRRFRRVPRSGVIGFVRQTR